MKDIIEWSTVEQGQWKLVIAKTDRGLCYVGSPGQSFEEVETILKKRYPNTDFKQNEESLQPYVEELKDCLNGSKHTFSLPSDVKGTPFQQEIWEALKQIPYGQTASYSDIAARIQRPTATRAVGAAIGANPLLITVPCHRVIGKNGAITGYRGGLELKRFLLELEKDSHST
ncbi:methylated-DNA--[protein]-cysteine S-methyltransferase [Planococcus salinus]|uniref:methylated-DNA--[protein]-cysteine S-methyltransferase n=1 Tax=Planococcus salinus TaxID=1848460 RepID=A0A3M8P3H7_9BACL|nr:methylated-DNA--[protein]-cysteine S-methyltransferase [Planococcus salinus]RNF38232.1 methylated-DNA--[protein]-cysteine S-methyltransferase [Planococcus salinus]